MIKVKIIYVVEQFIRRLFRQPVLEGKKLFRGKTIAFKKVWMSFMILPAPCEDAVKLFVHKDLIL